MTRAEFKALPMLLLQHQVVAATGYVENTLRKLVDCGVLELVKPSGCGWGRYRKLQIAKLAGIAREEVLEAWEEVTAGHPLLIGEKEAARLTGLSWHSLPMLLTPMRLAGSGVVRYRVEEIAVLCGVSDVAKGGKGGKKASNRPRTGSEPLTEKGQNRERHEL